jgi:hypothetical protein
MYTVYIIILIKHLHTALGLSYNVISVCTFLLRILYVIKLLGFINNK